MGHLRSFWGHLVTWNANLIGAINSASQKKLSNDILHAPKWDLVRKLRFQVLMGHLKSFLGHFKLFCDLKLEADKRNQASVPKYLWKDILDGYVRCHKVRFGNKVLFWGQYWSLEVFWRSFGGHEVTRNTNLMCAIDCVPKKT